ncbi:MAG: sulfotransferase [Mariprofundaceae bacterium]|nr:sulfotransferase [Mariprofundaceae bacterium]
MIPLRRCGSHALRLRLNFNQAFYSPYPLHVCDIMHLLPRYGDLSDDRNYFKLIIDLIGLQNASMVKWKGIALDPVVVFDAIKDHARSIHAIMWEMLLQAGEQNNAKVVMDKSLDSVVYAEEMFTLQPELLLLNVVRDPRAQVGSMNGAILYDFDTLGNTQRWVKAHNCARRLLTKYPERVLTIRFEDFILNQEAVLHTVCNFLGIKFSPSMLAIGNSMEARDISKLSALWQTNIFNPIAGNIDKFKKNLSLRDIELIETLTTEQMDFYGYDKMTPAKSIITDADLKASSLRSEKNRKLAWQQLEQENYRDYLLRKFRHDYIHNIETRLMADESP